MLAGRVLAGLDPGQLTDVHAHCDNLDCDAIGGFVAVLPLPGWSDHARELRLVAHPAVLEAAVIGVPQPTHGEELAAAVTPRPDGTATPEKLRDDVKARVAAYKYPRQVWLVDALPAGPTGKLLEREIVVPPEVTS